MQSPLYAQSPTIAVHLPSHPTAINAGSPCTPSSPNFAHLHHSTSTSTWTLPGEISLRPALALSPPSTVSSSGFALSPLNTGGGGAPSPLVEMNGTTTGGAGGATVGGGGLDYAALPSWQDPTVSLWLSAALPSLPTSSYALLFAQNDIRGSVLLEVDQSALKEMGVRSVGDRVKICVAVRALRGKYLAATGAGTGAGSVRGGVLGRVVAQGGMSRPGSPLVPSSPVNSPPSQYSAQFTSPPPSSSSNYAFASPPMTSSLPSTVSTMSSPQLSTISPASSSSIPSHHPPAAQAGFSLGHSRPGSYSARSLSTGNRIPPPLHLAQSNVHQYSASNLPSPAAPPPGGQQAAMLSASPPSRATSPRSAGLTPSRPIPPPSGPPPAGRAPLAPGNQQQNWLGDIPGLTSTAPGGGMTTSVSTGSISSLRSNTLPYNALASSSSSSAASSSTTLVPGHRKASSSSLVSSPLHSRPSTAQSSYAGHPYASTPTQATALLPSPLDRFSRPTTAATISSTSSGSSLTPPSASSSSASPNNLDIMRRAVKFTSADGVTSRVLAVADAKDGREVLARVMKKFGGGQGEDVEGWGVYTQSEAGGARLLTEHELYQICQNASAPERARGLVVRRHQHHHHLASTSSYSTLSASPPTSCAFSHSQPSSPSALSTSFPPTSASHTSPSKRGRKLQWVFGESHAPSAELTRPGGTAFGYSGGAGAGGAGNGSPTSPNYLGVEIPRMGIEPASPSSTSLSGDEMSAAQGVAAAARAAAQGQAQAQGPGGQGKTARSVATKMNRASTVSVMSGLEAPDWARDYYAQGEKWDGSASKDRDREREKEREREEQEQETRERESRLQSPPQRTSSRRTPPSPYTPASPPSGPIPAGRTLGNGRPLTASPSRHDNTLLPPPSHSSPSASAAAASTTRKLRNFFGQRPPSELITNHLTEYFPLGPGGGGGGAGGKGERTRLSKQVRASIRRSMSAASAGGGGGTGMNKRMSTASVQSRASSTRVNAGAGGGGSGGIGMGLGGVPNLPSGTTSWEKTPAAAATPPRGGSGGESAAMSRFSGSSNGSGAELHITAPTPSASTVLSPGGSLPLPVASDARSIGARSPRSSSGSVLDPPDEAEEESEEGDDNEGGDGAITPGSSSMASSVSSSTTSGPPSSSSAVRTPEADETDADTRSIASSSLAAPSLSAGQSGYLHPSRLSRRMSRMSGASRSSRLSVGAQSLWERRSKDSDAASVVTMDEVTAELETRRASGVSWGGGGGGGSYSDEEGEGGSAMGSDDGVEEERARFSDEEDDFEEEDEEELSDEDEEELEEIGTAKAENKGMKWIKGALIGQGSFGSVYLGMNPLTGSLMAVKQVELPTGNSHNEERKKSMLEALEREIELLKVLQHENIVQYLDSASDSEHLNIFLEYVPGGSVAALLQNYGAFEEALVSKFVRQILTGLDYLHEREIIHRDIKGANILVDNKGNIKISDFGISKKVEDNLLSGAKVHRPSLQGSVYWMAPEVVKQTAYTSKADIWSLGCLVVEMLTGAHPWANLTQMQAIFRIGSSIRPTVPDDISTDADDFLEQTFEIEHTARPPARELLQHPFIRDPDVFAAANQQTPTRATFSQQHQQSVAMVAVAPLTST